MAQYGSKQRGVRWQVLWGKHTPVHNETFRQGHRTYNDSALTANAIFPAVMVRDPYKWMQSMCRHEYAAHWPRSQHCPNVVPNLLDYAVLKHNRTKLTPTGGIPVQVHYKEFHTEHDTLVGFWNDWYKAYAKVQWPRLLVRFEDLVYYPKLVTKTVCECAGGELNPHRPFRIIVESAKRGVGQHGKERTTYIDALVKYGTEQGRYDGFDPEDLEYANKYLDPELMKMFQYKFAPEAQTSPDHGAGEATEK